MPTSVASATPAWKYTEAEIRRIFDEKCPATALAIAGVSIPFVDSETVTQSGVAGTWTVTVIGRGRAGDKMPDGTVRAADPPPDVFEIRETTLVPVPVGAIRGLTKCR